MQLLSHEIAFPNVENALSQPDGLLALGGDLSPPRLICAYRNGIFPWFSDDQPILWWSPSQRIGLSPHSVHISRSMAKFMRKTSLSVTINQAFFEVITHCAKLRDGNTWITPNMIAAYLQLHKQGHAHSIEVWQDNALVGGLYGVAVGRVFCGESMFSLSANASKMAFIYFCQHFAKHGGVYIDGQVSNSYLQSLGMTELARKHFISLLHAQRDKPLDATAWQKQKLSLS